MVRGTLLLVLSMTMASFFAPAECARAQDANAIAKEVNTELAAAQRVFFSGKYQEALTQVEAIEGKLEKLRAQNAAHPSLKSLETRCRKLRQDIEKRLQRPDAAGAGGGAAEGQAGAAGAAGAAGQEAALPAAAARCIRELDAALEKARRALEREGNAEGKVSQARYEMQAADSFWSDLEAKYPAALAHADAVAAKGRLAAMYEQIAAAEAGLAAEQARQAQAAGQTAADSATWIAKLGPYVAHAGESGHDPEKEFISGYTEEAAEMKKRMRLFAEASAAFAEFRASGLAGGGSDELQQIEKELAWRLESFRTELDGAVARNLEEAEAEVKRCAEFLAANEARCADGQTKPYLLQKDILPDLMKKVAWIENLRPGDSRAAGLKAGIEELNAAQSRWRERFIESTVMLPEQYAGEDAQLLRDKAEAVVKEQFVDAEVLRVLVISPDWEEESALEFTDTTHSALRYRVTRSVTVQVAARRGAECFLYTVYVGKDRQSDGAFGPLMGHVMFTDRMLEENVGK